MLKWQPEIRFSGLMLIITTNNTHQLQIYTFPEIKEIEL